MFSKNEKRSAEIVSKILSDEGFDVKKEFKIRKGLYADIVGFKDDEIILVEVKPSGFRLDQSDFMQVSGYMGALTEKFGDRKISGCIVSSGGTLSPATIFKKQIGIHVIESDKEEEIERGLLHCMRTGQVIRHTKGPSRYIARKGVTRHVRKRKEKEES